MSPTNDADRRWAADQLGVAADAAPAEVRTALLRRLPALNFTPMPPMCAAAAELTGRAIPGANIAEPDDDGDNLRFSLNQFAESFWSLPRAERRSRYQILLGRAAADPLVTGRLQRLEAGLDVPSAAGDSGPPRPREIVGMIQTLFVLGPIQRAARRRELLDNLPPPASAWEQAARHVQHHYPIHAALEPALLERLSTWARRLRPAARGIARPAATWGFQQQVGLRIPQSPPVFDRPPPKRKHPTWLVIFLILLVLRAVGSFSSSSRESPRDPPVLSPPPKISTWRPAADARPDLDKWNATRRLFDDDTTKKLQGIGQSPPPTDRGPP